MPVALVTDTTHYLPAPLAAELGLHQVSLYVIDGEGQRRESDVDADAFYAGLPTATTHPRTSQPSIGDFLAVYEPLVEAGNDVVSVHLSAGVSGTCDSARQAAAELSGRGRRVEVVDSRTGAGGLALVLLAAAAAVRAGADLDAVVRRTQTAIEDNKIFFALDTLEYLRRGGRIGSAQAWVGGALKIRPILSFDGLLEPIERVRTTARARDRLLEYLQARKEDGHGAWIVQHTAAAEDAAVLVERGTELMGCEPVSVSQVGPVIGTHAGPGMLGVGSVRPELLR